MVIHGPLVLDRGTGNDQEGEERLEPVEALRKITDFLKKEEAAKHPNNLDAT